MKKLITIFCLLVMTTTSYAVDADQYSIFPGQGKRPQPFLMFIDKIGVDSEGILQITEAKSGAGGKYKQGNSLQEYRVIREQSTDQRFGHHITTFRVINVNFIKGEPEYLTSLKVGDTIEFNNVVKNGWEQGLFKIGPHKMNYAISRNGPSNGPQVRLCRGYF